MATTALTDATQSWFMPGSRTSSEIIRDQAKVYESKKKGPSEEEVMSKVAKTDLGGKQLQVVGEELAQNVMPGSTGGGRARDVATGLVEQATDATAAATSGAREHLADRYAQDAQTALVTLQQENAERQARNMAKAKMALDALPSVMSMTGEMLS